MISWIVIVILVLVGIFAIKMNHLRHRIFIILLVLFALFLYLSITLITVQNELDLSSTKGFLNGIKVYGGWVAHSFTNLKALTGDAIGMDWTSTNASFFDSSKDEKDKKDEESGFLWFKSKSEDKK